MSKYIYLLYDMRAYTGDTDDANVLSVSSTMDEALDDAKELYGEGVVYRYRTEGDELKDELEVGGYWAGESFNYEPRGENK